jgi:D-glutamate cyclase
MSDALLAQLRDLIQVDAGQRGLRTDPGDNLITACSNDFADACRSLAGAAQAKLLIVTGFYIVDAPTPCGETDGPLGALFLARALQPLGVEVILATDTFCLEALRTGLEACQMLDQVGLLELPNIAWDEQGYEDQVFGGVGRSSAPLTHLLAIERVGPSHTTKSVKAQLKNMSETLVLFQDDVWPEQRDRCYSMSGRDLTPYMSPAHLLFEEAPRHEPPVVTLGIGDGGNEIGMGKIPWDVIRRNIRGGSKIACRVPVDHLIVAGVSNWGAYALAAGVRALRGAAFDAELFSVERERQLLEMMVEFGPLVDGVTKQRTTTVDGLTWEQYAAVMDQIAAQLVREW